MERPQDIYYLDEMDIGWLFELMQYSDNGKTSKSGSTGGSKKEVYIDQVLGF
ncbi:hypothetical protein B4146_3458 [Bacillus subtilis]|uniref:Uncharacterized protein n=1 Tax=Bacillus subtilis TaxID=1423 RepID=A0AAP1E7W5_BACIU|nr:hypothetical protein B4146_3458 [Bacillus subtilis]KZD90356.1 hypothetical protein B4122_3277 [Bacillus subtilis]